MRFAAALLLAVASLCSPSYGTRLTRPAPSKYSGWFESSDEVLNRHWRSNINVLQSAIAGDEDAMAVIPGVSYTTGNFTVLKSAITSQLSTGQYSLERKIGTLMSAGLYYYHSADDRWVKRVWGSYTAMLADVLDTYQRGERGERSDLHCRARIYRVLRQTIIMQHDIGDSDPRFKAAVEEMLGYAARGELQYPDALNHPDRMAVLWAGLDPNVDARPYDLDLGWPMDVIEIEAQAHLGGAKAVVGNLREHPSIAVTVALMEQLVGIKFVGAAGKRWLIKPDLAGLEYVRGGIETPIGRFAVRVERNQLEIEVPDGTSGLVNWSGGGPRIEGGGKWRWRTRQGVVMGGKVMSDEQITDQVEFRKVREVLEKKEEEEEARRKVVKEPWGESLRKERGGAVQQPLEETAEPALTGRAQIQNFNEMVEQKPGYKTLSIVESHVKQYSALLRTTFVEAARGIGRRFLQLQYW